MRPSASSNGPAHAPAPTSTTASGTGPTRSDIGVRNGNRNSSPYAIELAAVCETDADSANTAATIAVEPARSADAALVLVTDANVSNTTAGARRFAAR